MNSIFLFSSRLLFIATTPELLRAELVSTSMLAKMLNVAIPEDWPPGEYDQDAQKFFLRQLSSAGEAAIGWYGWYVIVYPQDGLPATLVASAGYFGPPDESGTVEIGYSVSAGWQRQGIATELVGVLTKHALHLDNVKRVIAHASPGNNASIKALLANGFALAGSARSKNNCFEHSLT